MRRWQIAALSVACTAAISAGALSKWPCRFGITGLIAIALIGSPGAILAQAPGPPLFKKKSHHQESPAPWELVSRAIQERYFESMP